MNENMGKVQERLNEKFNHFNPISHSLNVNTLNPNIKVHYANIQG